MPDPIPGSPQEPEKQGADEAKTDRLEQIQEALIKKLQEMFATESTGHDLSHLVRTRNLAREIQKEEGGDEEVVVISALLHDLHRLMQEKGQKFVHPKDSLATVKSMLDEFGLAPETVDKILHSIEFHEEYSFSFGQYKKGENVTDIETLILQDADNLDAIGAIGIARTFTFDGAHNVPIWRPEIPLGKDTYDESELDPSGIHHFYSKLLKLKENMNTKTGKKIAEERHAFMEQFLDRLFKEWSGEL